MVLPLAYYFIVTLFRYADCSAMRSQRRFAFAGARRPRVCLLNKKLLRITLIIRLP